MMTMEKIKSMKQITLECKELNQNPLANIGLTVGLAEETNIFEWFITLIGPKDSIYKGGMFWLKVKFPENYPESPPQILFITPIYHLNVNSSSKSGIPLGTIYCNSLNYWKNYYTIKKVIPEIFVLLYKNNPDCGYDIERNEEFQNNRKLFEENARFFTKKYANQMVCSEFRYKKVSEWDFSKSI